MIATRLRALILTGVIAALLAGGAPTARAARSAKGIWGPVTNLAGVSKFPIYHDLGVGIYQIDLLWYNMTVTRPRHPRDPNDPAYHWPVDVRRAVQQARKFHMRVMLEVIGTPAWENGGRTYRYPPRARDMADFLVAAARHYRSVHLWMIWGEPSRHGNFATIVPAVPTARRLTAAQKKAPHQYAQMLDASYGALKSVSRRNLVIGGNTYTTGDVSTRQWIDNLRLPNGRPPRMDLYGHNPFSFRAPNLSNPPSPQGEVDFSDLGRLSQLVNRKLARRHQRIKLYLAEWSIPTAARDSEFNFYVSPAVQARWITDAWRIVRRTNFIYSLGWIHLYDAPPAVLGSRGGLLDFRGHRKPGYYAFKAG